MGKPIAKRRIGMALKIVAAIFSAGTAGVTIFTFARSYGLIGAPAPAVLTVGTLGVSWVSLTPAADTATSLGDTIRLAATVTDDNGTSLIGATIRWSSDDPGVAEAIGGGKVVARHAGTATIIASVGDKLARARVTVRQRIATVRVNGDSALTLGEGERRRMSVRALDARGYSIPLRHVAWRSLDTSIVTVDSTGVATAHAQGIATVTAEIDGVPAQAPVNVAPVPGALEVVAGGAQHALVGATLARPVAVRLLSTRGQPVPGVAVRFRTADGRGVADPPAMVTDARGIARTSWTLGALPGRQRLLATNERLDSAAVVVAEAEPVAANTRVAQLGDGLTGRAGEMLTDTVAVRVADTLGRTLGDVPVAWSADDHGRVIAIGDRTDSLGEARATWMLGPRSGVQHLRVRVGSGHSVPAFVISGSATAGPAASIVAVAGNAQRGRVGAALPKQVVLRAMDAAGNAVPGVTLALRASAGDLSDSTPVTDSAGEARITWTMPRTAGVSRLSVRADGVAKSLALAATALPARAANITFAESERAPIAGKPFGKSVGVTVTDVYGNPIAGVVVNFAARSGHAAPLEVATDGDGVARTRWTLGTREGDQTLTARVSSGAAVLRSALTVTVGEQRTAARTPRARGATPVRETEGRPRQRRNTSGSGGQ